MSKLASFIPFQIAEKAVTENIDALKPEQAQIQQKLTKALDDLREGVAATERAVRERCQMRTDRMAVQVTDQFHLRRS